MFLSCFYTNTFGSENFFPVFCGITVLNNMSFVSFGQKAFTNFNQSVLSVFVSIFDQTVTFTYTEYNIEIYFLYHFSSNVVKYIHGLVSKRWSKLIGNWAYKKVAGILVGIWSENGQTGQNPVPTRIFSFSTHNLDKLCVRCKLGKKPLSYA